uniref:Uncharacterized protein n=1 Tax=Grammatophora oceanica TaxID=210454 RepID=A0A7S1Y551_9STRA
MFYYSCLVFRLRLQSGKLLPRVNVSWPQHMATVSPKDLDVDQGDFDFDPDHYDEEASKREKAIVRLDNGDLSQVVVAPRATSTLASSSSFRFLRNSKVGIQDRFQIKQYWAEGQVEARERRLECAGHSGKGDQNLWTMKCDSDEPAI